MHAFKSPSRRTEARRPCQRFVSLTVAFLALAALLSPRPATATTWDDKPKILLHVKAVTTKNICTTWGDLSDCTQAVTRGQTIQDANGPFYFMYVLVATGAYRAFDLGGNELGLAGAQFGIAYDPVASSGLDVFSWTLCATLEFVSTGWPESGGGQLLTWDSSTRCVKTEVGVAGYFYCGAYSTDLVRITARPVDSAMKVATCNSAEIDLNDMADAGTASFSPAGDTDGCNPCSASCDNVPVRSTTWTQLKTLWR